MLVPGIRTLRLRQSLMKWTPVPLLRTWVSVVGEFAKVLSRGGVS